MIARAATRRADEPAPPLRVLSRVRLPPTRPSMETIKPKLVTDAEHRPAAAQLDYDDWLRFGREKPRDRHG